MKTPREWDCHRYALSQDCGCIPPDTLLSTNWNTRIVFLNHNQSAASVTDKKLLPMSLLSFKLNIVIMKVLKSSILQSERPYNLRRPTALGKKSILNTDFHLLHEDNWHLKRVSDWQPIDVAQWISSVADKQSFSFFDIDMSRFNVDGKRLVAMTHLDFSRGDAAYGDAIFTALQEVVQKDVAAAALQEPKKRRGRPVTNSQCRVKPKKRFRLWEFLLYLLSKPEYCPSVVEWEKPEEGSFRIKQSSKLAELWGKSRGRSNMDYVKLSRLMRYYYKQEVLIADKQRLVYRFGPNADGWKEISQAAVWPDIYE